jgi:hypothetical protein
MDGDGEWANVSLSKDENNYLLDWEVPGFTIDMIDCRVIFFDEAGNSIEITFRIQPVDRAPPIIQPIGSLTFEEGEEFDIEINISDNVKVDEITWYNLPCSTSGTHVVGPVDEPGTYEITVMVYDSSMNEAVMTFNITITEKEEETSLPSFLLPAIIIAVIMILLLIAAVLILIRMKRARESKEKEKEEEDEKRAQEEQAADKQLEYQNLYGGAPSVPDQSPPIDYQQTIPEQSPPIDHQLPTPGQIPGSEGPSTIEGEVGSEKKP